MTKRLILLVMAAALVAANIIVWTQIAELVLPHPVLIAKPIKTDPMGWRAIPRWI